MDYIISEDRLIRLVDKYITSMVGELIKTNSSHQLGDENGNMIFQYFGKHLGVSKDLFSNLHGLFAHMNVSETENLIQLWFEKKYPNEPVQAVYYSIYY